MDDTRIRPAVPGDRAEIEACVNAAYQMYVERMGNAPAPMLADYASLIAARSVYVADQDGVLGVLVIEPRDDHLFVENVAVHPDAQGRGLGQRLMRFAEDRARQHGLDDVRLYTNEMMVENLGYYAHLGYRETDRRYEHGYHRVYMRKRLNGQG